MASHRSIKKREGQEGARPDLLEDAVDEYSGTKGALLLRSPEKAA
jgi:hypothetical protein